VAAEYKVGQRVRLLEPMVNPNSTWMPVEEGMPVGLEGIITYVSCEGHPDLHQLGVKWDNGRSLGLIPGKDIFTVMRELTDAVGESPTKLDRDGLCPACGTNWNAGDIFETFKQMRAAGDSFYVNKTDEEIEEIAGQYGWTRENPVSFSRLIGVEIRGEYDGVSYWRCPDCNHQWPRFKKG